MKQNTVDEVNNIMDSFDKDENKNVVGISNDPLDTMNTKMVAFFTARIDNIAKSENLSLKVQKALEDKVEEKEEEKKLTFEQLLKLFNAIKNNTSIASEGILSLLRPVNGTSNKLIDNLVENNQKEDKAKDLFDSLDKEDMEKLINLVNTLKLIDVANVNEDSE